MRRGTPLILALLFTLLAAAPGAVMAASGEKPRDIHYTATPPAPKWQPKEAIDAKSVGCMSCHTETDEPSMHRSGGVPLGCTDCHGGNASVMKPSEGAPSQAAYRTALDKAHVQPLYPESWQYPASANPERSYTLLNRESPEFIRFVNPSDYRVVDESCGACHAREIRAAKTSLMSTGAMLWGGAAYNNGILPYKNYLLGEAYTRDGQPAALTNPVPPTDEMKAAGVLEKLVPMPAWEVIPPGDIFRVFERGGRNIVNLFPEIGLPNALGQLQRLEEPGRPDLKQSNRGPGTGLRIAVPVINIHKTRLNDPFTWFLGTNDQPGDFRSSGCASCHVVYANDRDPRHSGPYSKHGHMGVTDSKDPTIPRNEPGHPLRHEFTSAIPTSQCMVCHMHQPNVFVNSFLGYTMWDYESDAPHMWPKEQKYPSNAEMHAILERNPEEAAIRGLWGDRAFLAKVSEMNPKLNNTQFADYHGHGWNFRAIFKKDEAGNLLDKDGNVVSPDDPDKFKKAVHMSSIHLDVGMHCVDCHFEQDAHGNGHLYGEVANAIEITCQDCHGTADDYPTLLTSGPAAPEGGNDISLTRNSDGSRRFEWRGKTLVQRSALWPGLEWQVSLVKNTVDPASADYNAKAARAKLMKGDPDDMSWGPGVPKEARAHKDDEMECFTCHLSWTTSCAGCHLPIQANWKTERHHYEGGETRNYATYNPQVVRDQMFQLGRHSTAKGNTIAPVRSSSALILSSTNINRERIYIQQPPIAASGYSSQAFAPHFPHTVRKEETKTCSDCHLSEKNDNNARMAQLLLLGTNFVNFVGYNAWIGGEGGVEAVRVTEWDEPQAVIGSYLQRYAYPDWYEDHQKAGRELKESYAHDGPGAANCLQLRGEYLYTAEGPGGFHVYDVASIANKGFSQRIITAPFSELGHDTQVETANATCMALPSTQPIHPPRNEGELMRVTNQEQPFHPIYNYALVTDAEEGLILVNVNTMADGEPRNNFLDRAVTWNEDGVLDGARHVTVAGHFVYVTTPDSLVVLDLDDPLAPTLVKQVPMDDPRATAVQFRYLFVSDREGVKVFDVTDPRKISKVPGAMVPLADAHRIYVARTYAYVAAGRDGLAILNVKNPTMPKLHQMFDADGAISDARDVVVGSTNASLFAYVADGVNGLKVIQLTAPDTQPRFYGFSPEPKPELIAWKKTAYPALALSKGLDRDRGVDETGGQIAIFGRLGSRPFTLEEMQHFYLNESGAPYFVSDEIRQEDFVAAGDRRQAKAN
jgi:hypothetical protein